MQGFYTILLLVASNIFMTCAWYGHLKMRQEYTFLRDFIFTHPSMSEALNDLFS